MATPYCRRCLQSIRCGRCHLYVIELDYALTGNRRFMAVNSSYRSGMDCLYVGSSAHAPDCRFLQHREHAKKRALGYTCTCDGRESFHEFVRGGGRTRGSYYPGVYGMRLRPDLFLQYNPIADQEKATLMEERLARYLRSLGYAVWQH